MHQNVAPEMTSWLYMPAHVSYVLLVYDGNWRKLLTHAVCCRVRNCQPRASVDAGYVSCGPTKLINMHCATSLIAEESRHLHSLSDAFYTARWGIAAGITMRIQTICDTRACYGNNTEYIIVYARFPPWLPGSVIRCGRVVLNFRCGHYHVVTE